MRHSFALATAYAICLTVSAALAADDRGVDDLADGIKAVRKHIQECWPKTVVRSDPDNKNELALPKPYVVPTIGPQFHSFFYWDTFFTNAGLLRDGQQQLARDNAENLIFEVEQLGFVPNSNANWGHNRTQTPLACAIYADVYAVSKDREFLAKAYAASEREWAFFAACRDTPCGLNRCYHNARPAELWRFAKDISSRLPTIPADGPERLKFSGHALAECEVWDFTPRFDRRGGDFCPIDTNSALYVLERNAAAMADELGNGRGDLWRQRAEKRKQAFSKHCWNEAEGMFFDYDWANDRQSEIASAATFFPLWAGLATPQQAARVHAHLKKFEYDHGITTCLPGKRPQAYQWDHPNGWPPLQMIAIEGLRRYGWHDDARRLARKYVALVVRTFGQTGNLWEKYEVVKGGLDVGDEYKKMPTLVGWSAGVFVYCCDVLDNGTKPGRVSGTMGDMQAK